MAVFRNVHVVVDQFNKTHYGHRLKNSPTDSARIFYHNYPNNPYIVAQYTSRNKSFQSRYKIIELGYYLQNVKYTQKRKNIQYQIPDGYAIKTEVANKALCCETKYICYNKVLFTITWKEDRAEWMVSSERSSSGAVNTFLKKINRENSQLSGIHIFRLDIEILYQTRIEKSKELSMAKTITNVNKRKHPLNELSLSQQKKTICIIWKRYLQEC
ncbi:11476_t:CDS:2 [Dentiscutata erythropus]|uniref:11476_t:CDS:1 n=1 Tax=Dentiscutata erythropus TaxID=1348616 RepID=A0A9N8W8M5_9GLOM|nr:11476_t:CDS:2 [Dentiscutata erythropus]